MSLENALAYEAAIADEAAEIRAGEDLSPALFLRLWPLLGRPIPPAYIVTHPAVKGKPYESTGIRSVQVQIDRMNNVLTPLGWWDVADYEADGKLCRVTIGVGRSGEAPWTTRSSWGGVGQGSTAGNVYKGSYTNAAKRAFAALGVGHEVYLGTADLDPDVNADVVAGDAEPSRLGPKLAKKLVDRAWTVPEAKEKLQLAASHAAGRDVGDCDTKAKATAALGSLTYGQAEKLDAWIGEKEAGR